MEHRLAVELKVLLHPHLALCEGGWVRGSLSRLRFSQVVEDVALGPEPSSHMISTDTTKEGCLLPLGRLDVGLFVG